MAGELCGRGCGWCGRCDAKPDYVCDDCDRADCLGHCPESIDANQDERCDDTEERSVSTGRR